MRKTRYQVLYDGKTPQDKGGIQNFSNKKDAEKAKRLLEKEGYQNVSVWDTENNSLSNMFRL